jgi:DNA processing protein
MSLTERQACIAFNLTDKIGSVSLNKLKQEFGSAAEAWEQLPEEKRVSRSGLPIDAEREEELAKRYGVRILTLLDDDYPPLLKSCSSHPLCLYVKGSVEALSLPAVAMVGTRKATVYGTDQAFLIARGLAERGVAVVSGLALGIDAASHQGALAGGGVTIGVIGSALDRFYPEQNRQLAREIIRQGGAVVSQFPFGRECDTTTFPIRNQVVAGMSLGVVAIEAPVRSGTLITCRDALDLGRSVMALPGRVDSRASQGCLNLIAEGARMIRHADDICTELGLETVPKETVSRPDPTAAQSFSLEESLVMRHVDLDGVPMDKLVALTRLEPSKVSALCMALRLKGRIRFLPGNRVALPRQA